MARTPNIAIEIGRSRVRAIRAQFKRGRLTVRQVLAAPFPDDLNLETPKELGAWLGDQLRTAGVTRGRGRGRGPEPGAGGCDTRARIGEHEAADIADR
jgi:hypothetical protein